MYYASRIEAGHLLALKLKILATHLHFSQLSPGLLLFSTATRCIPVAREVAAAFNTDVISLGDNQVDARLRPSVQERTVILIDDGKSSETYLLRIVTELQSLHPARVLLAMPSANGQRHRLLYRVVDDIIYATTQSRLYADEVWYGVSSDHIDLASQSVPSGQ